jgi:hypothetical protein
VINSTLKTAFFKAIDLLPASIGYAIYHQVQERLTSSFLGKIEANARSYTELTKILASQGITIQGKNILEIGSGWMPLMPYHFKVDGGCNKVYTFDINDHYQNKYIDQLNAHYKAAGKLNFDVVKTGLHLPDFIDYRPHGNVITADLPADVDIIFSRFVLEHVTPKDMVAMHKRFAQVYGDQVAIVHLISPSDHRAFSDSSISHYDFLQYSQKEWDGIQTKFDYHNRLRLPQFLALFEEAGMAVEFLEHDQATPGSAKWEKYKKLVIHQDFAAMTDLERTAGSINVLLRAKTIANS